MNTAGIIDEKESMMMWKRYSPDMFGVPPLLSEVEASREKEKGG